MKNLAPYQILFPFGFFAALLGAGLWLWPEPAFLGVPVQWIHSKLMIGCFLWSFITGFLMTAIPRMTGTKSSSDAEVLWMLALLILSTLTAFWADGAWFQGVQIVLALSLMGFALSRLMRKTKTVPVFFSHVGLALGLALAGRIFALLGHSWMGFFLADVGVLLLLVLGIGTRFYSFLSGLPSEFEQAPPVHRKWFHFLGVVLAAFLVFAGVWRQAWAYAGLFVLSLIYLQFVWKVFRMSARSSALKWIMRIVAFCIPSAFLLCALRPDLYLIGLHILFIGVFGMITFAVASRVILAHGSYPLEMETRSKALWAFLALIMVSLALRLLYGFSEGTLREVSLKGAAIFWLAALGVWCWSFGLKTFFKGELAKPAC